VTAAVRGIPRRPASAHRFAARGPSPAGAAAPRRRRWAGAWGAVFVCSWGGNQFSPLLLMYEDRAHYSSLTVNALLGVYVLGLAPALLIAGSLSDRHGRRPVLLAGIATAVAGSVLLALGPLGPGFLAAGRLFSGVTVGIAMAAGSSWIKELSQAPFDPAADPAAGARRSALAFSLGAALGALVAGLIAQWGPIPEVLPFLIHIAVTVPFAYLVLATPETRQTGQAARDRAWAGPWWRQFRVPSAGHRRFTRVVAVAAPWLFGAAALGYGYLPTQLRGVTGSWGIMFATTATVVALGTSSAIQPLAKRLHTAGSARGLAAGVGTLAVGIAGTALAIGAQSIVAGLAANVVIGAGIGITMVSGLLEVQRIATAADLASLTGLFYALAYAGFLTPVVVAAVAASVPVTVILWVITGLAVISWAFILRASTSYLPSPEERQVLPAD
jgi:MFS family permease